MYIPKKHQIENTTEIKEFLLQNSFGALLSLTNARIVATHVPWHLVENEAGEWLLKAHVAKANPQWKNIEQNKEVMLMFQGAHSYISSTWYSHENAPTWNYQAIHLYGQARIVSEEELIEMLACLMHKYEKDMPTPLRYQDLSEKLRESYLKSIVGIEVKVTEIQAQYKLSQNRNAFDYQHIIEQLEHTKDAQAQEVAKQMRRVKDL